MPRHLRPAAIALLAVLALTAAASARGSDPEHPLQWGVSTVRAPEAWTVSRGGSVVVAVLDSGVARDHLDLAGRVLDGVSCRHTGGDPDRCEGAAPDMHGHGTHVAGIVAASPANDVGVAGVAPDASILPVRVLFSDCATCPLTGNADDVVAAVRWATAAGADVLNLSLGSTADDLVGPAFVEAAEAAWAAGAIPVVAAGNNLVRSVDLGQAPVVVVSATDRHDRAPAYSNGVGSARWALAAPGGGGADSESTCAIEAAPSGILSTFWYPDDPNGAYACQSGTSMAAPAVSGALAVLLATGASPAEAVDRLLATAVDLGDPGRDTTFGAGRIDLAAAVGLDGPVPPGPLATTRADRRVPAAIAATCAIAALVAGLFVARRVRLRDDAAEDPGPDGSPV